MTYRDFLRHAPPIEVLDRLIAAGLGNRRPQTDITEAEFDRAMRMETFTLKGVLADSCAPDYRAYTAPRASRLDLARRWQPRARREVEVIWPAESLRVSARMRRMILRAE